MWLVKVFSVIYLAAVCAAQEAPRGAPAKPHLKLLIPWTDVFQNETVPFICEVNGPNWTNYSWYNNQNKLDDSNLMYELGIDDPTLNVTDISPDEQGGYACKAALGGVSSDFSNTVHITVYENLPTPKVSQDPSFNLMYTGETVKFTCNVDIASGWSYEWYKDGEMIPETSKTISISLQPNDEAKYSCKAIRGQTMTDFSEEISQDILEIPVPSLTRKTLWLDVFPDESVQLSCGMSGSSDWIYTWRKDGQEVQANTDVSFDSNRATLSIKSASAAHKGQYTCSGKLNGRSVHSNFSSGLELSVYDKKPSVTLIQDPDYKTMFAGESVSFNCHINVSTGWEYLWYKDGTKLAETANKYTIKSVETTNQGSYKCQAQRGTNQVFSTASSQAIQLAIQNNKPKPVMTQQPDVDKVYTGESVSFSCKVELTSGWEYSWFKDGVQQSIKSNIFTISAVSLSDSGTYDCMATRNKTMYETMHSDKRILQVSEIPVPSLTQKTQWLDVFPDESVQLSCGMSGSSDWIYTWRKDGQEVQANTDVSFDSNRATLSIKSASAAHKRQYTCSGKLKGRSVRSDFSSGLELSVYDKKPSVTLIQDPDYKTMFPGESVSFNCHINVSTGWEYLWYKDGTKLAETANKYTIKSVETTNQGSYKCQAQRGTNQVFSTASSQAIQLAIQKIPVPSLTQKTSWLDVFPGESVQLSCGMSGSSDWIYTWRKDGQEVQANTDVSFDSNRATLSIKSASAAHKGQYTCSGNLKGRSVRSNFSSGLKLSVYDTKPRVTLMQNPSDNVLHTGDSVSFSCHINVSTGWEYLWHKDGVELDESGNNYTIPSVLTKNTGKYKCQTKRGRNTVFHSDQSQAVNLDIKERPQADVSLLTGWSEAFSTDNLVLKCVVKESNEAWNYTWFKEDQPIYDPPTEKYIVTPQNNPEQSLYTCQGIRTRRPFNSKRSDHFKTKNLLLKRRVLLSILGCIFFGIIFTFIGCIVLKVTRKTAKDEYRPEETELFFNMAQRKEGDDTPCPLVEYITDAALNTPPKEEEQNGKICSDATPLPITQPEDEAVKTESSDATENNDGLVSFKQ